MNIMFLHNFESGNNCCIVEYDGANNLVVCYSCMDHDLEVGVYSWDSMLPVEGEPNTISLTQRNRIKTTIENQLASISNFPF